MSFAAILTGFAGLFLAAAPAQQDEWARYQSPDQSFSVEVPCAADEMEKLEAVPSGTSPGLGPDKQARVFCLQGKMTMVASIVAVPEDQLEDLSLFDMVLDSATAQAEQLDESASFIIDGRRAFKNAETSEDYKAQTSVIEIAKNKILLAVVGGPLAADGSSANMDMVIDRFISSIKVAGA